MKDWYKKATKFETGKRIMLDRDAPVALITHTYVHNSNYWFVITEDAEKRRFHDDITRRGRDSIR